MADLSTTYLGLELTSPVLVGASTLSHSTDNIKKSEDAGAGALVIHSLFQEQMEIDAADVDDALTQNSESFAEAITYFPTLPSAGIREHIMWVEKARKSVRMPLIGSLNASSVGNWIDFASELENAGCDALELNLYSIETRMDVNAAAIESEAIDIIAAVKSEVEIPVAVKLSPWYTSLPNFAYRAVQAGADGLVLFNRFYQPTIDPLTETLTINLELSRSEDTRLPLRWIALLSDTIDTDFSASTGIHTADDAVRHLLAGAKSVQTVSSLYTNGISHISAINTGIEKWMVSKGYSRISEFRGKAAKTNVADPYAYERAQYARVLHEYDARVASR